MTFPLPWPYLPASAKPDSLEEHIQQNFDAIAMVLGELSDRLRIVRGSVDSSGDVVYGDGYSPNKTGTGAYTITFSDAFAVTPSVVVSASQTSNVIATATAGGHTTTDFTVQILTTSGGATDCGFDFVAVG